jgi:hypothetical protein
MRSLIAAIFVADAPLFSALASLAFRLLMVVRALLLSTRISRRNCWTVDVVLLTTGDVEVTGDDTFGLGALGLGELVDGVGVDGVRRLLVGERPLDERRSTNELLDV